MGEDDFDKELVDAILSIDKKINDEYKERIALKDIYCVYCGIPISSLDYKHAYRCEEEYEKKQKEMKKENKKKLEKNWRWKFNIKRQYNLKASQYYKMLRNQNYKCAICGIEYFRYIKERKKKKLNIDHNHKSGKVRGLLCYKCNLNVSVFELPKVQKEKILEYIKMKGM
jgi:hypothetical protein